MDGYGWCRGGVVTRYFQGLTKVSRHIPRRGSVTLRDLLMLSDRAMLGGR
jgi:hypothetical protein